VSLSVVLRRVHVCRLLIRSRLCSHLRRARLCSHRWWGLGSHGLNWWWLHDLGTWHRRGHSRPHNGTSTSPRLCWLRSVVDNRFAGLRHRCRNWSRNFDSTLRVVSKTVGKFRTRVGFGWGWYGHACPVRIVCLFILIRRYICLRLCLWLSHNWPVSSVWQSVVIDGVIVGNWHPLVGGWSAVVVLPVLSLSLNCLNGIRESRRMLHPSKSLRISSVQPVLGIGRPSLTPR